MSELSRPEQSYSVGERVIRRGIPGLAGTVVHVYSSDFANPTDLDLAVWWDDADEDDTTDERSADLQKAVGILNGSNRKDQIKGSRL